MKIQQLMTQITEAFDDEWVGRRFDDMSDVHSDIRRIGNQFIPKNLEMGVWDIRLKDEYIKLFEYSLDITDDKRYKFSRAGRVNKMTVTPAIKVSEDATLEELIFEAKKKEAEESVENTLSTLDVLKKDVSKYEAQLAERQEYLATFQ